MNSLQSQPIAKPPAPKERDARVRVGHVYLDLKRRSLRCLNETARQLHAEGIPLIPADLPKRPLLNLHGEAITADELPLIQAWREGASIQAEFLVPSDRGPEQRISWSASPLLASPDEPPVGVLGTITCVPHDPQWQLLAELAHDLATPLGALGLLSSIADKLPPEDTKLRQALQSMTAAADRAMLIGRELLAWCRGSLRKPQSREPSWFALEPVLLGLANEQTLAAQRKGLELAIDVTAVRGWEILTDPLEFGRILANLLSNAVRYTTHGRVEFTASWRDEAEGRVLAIGVVDTGPGITQEEQDSILQPFERGRAGKEGDPSGSGLGLAVADRLVDELGLTLDVYSEYGRGSEFHLLVPAEKLRKT